jgi:flagellar hook-length control protein FliK
MIQSFFSSLLGSSAGSKANGAGVGKANGKLASTSGSKFMQVLTNIMGRKKAQPTAYIRGGKEVTFSNIPFFNTDGVQLSVKSNGKSLKISKRRGRLGARNQSAINNTINRQKLLSHNKGVSQSVPEFKERAKTHLEKTFDLRAGIASGKLETPGNKSGILHRKLEEEMKKEDVVVNATWLEQVNAHMNRKSNSGGLRSLAEAMNAGKKSTVPIQQEKIEVEQPVGSKKRSVISKFQPQRIDPKTGVPIIDNKAQTTKATGGVKSANAKVHYIDKAIKNLRTPDMADVGKIDAKLRDSLSTLKTGKENTLVDRITFEKVDKTLPAPATLESRSREIVRTLRSGRAQSKVIRSDDSNLVANRPKTSIFENKTVVNKAGIKPELNKVVMNKAGIKPELNKVVLNKPEFKATLSRNTQEPSTAKNSFSDHVISKPNKAEPVIQKSKTTAPQTVHTEKPQNVDDTITRMKESGWHIHTPEKDLKKPRARRMGQRTTPITNKTRSSNSVSVKASDNNAPTETKSTATKITEKNYFEPKLERAEAVAIKSENVTSEVQVARAENIRVEQQTQITNNAKFESLPHNNAQESAKGIKNLNEILQKMKAHARILSSDGVTSLKIQLKPASLGSLSVIIQEHNGRYEVSVNADNSEAAKIIESQLPMLKDQLQSAGIEVDRFNVGSDNNKANNPFGDKSGKNAGGQRRQNGSTHNGGQPDQNDDLRERSKRTLSLGSNTVEYLG